MAMSNARSGWWRYSRRAHSAVIGGKLLNTSSASATGRRATAGWWGLALLTLLYGTGITILFTVLPRLGVVGNSAVMNVEPVFALVLAWLILGQAIAPVQVVGALIVVGAVIWLGMRKK